MVNRVLLLCGILSSVAYAIGDVGGGLQWPGYSFADYSISELAAIGAPSRPFVAGVFAIHGVLLMAFAAGVMAGRYDRSARNAAAFLGAVAIVGTVSSYFPIQQRGVAFSRNEILHLTLVALSVLCIVAAMITGGRAGSRGFRSMSITAAVVMVTFGALGGRFASRIAAGDPTPWLGVIERISVYCYILWVAAFANLLLQQRESGTRNAAAPGVFSRL
jgi:Protein of unknown function (DUF998)